jgi:beta-glucosidase
MVGPELWAALIAGLTAVLKWTLAVPLLYSVPICVALAVLYSTVVLSVRYGLSARLREEIRNTTVDSLDLPPGFLFGCATAAHQVEGGNTNDWTEWEVAKGWEPSGMATDTWNLFPCDVQKMVWLGLNAFRLSVEWSRIQPVRGEWDEAALQRYVGWCRLLRQNGIEPLITLWHFTLPTWVLPAGGFADESVRADFATFAARVATALCPYVDRFITCNELSLWALNSAVTGMRPCDRRIQTPGNLQTFLEMLRDGCKVHAAAYHAIHAVHSAAQVSLAANIIDVIPARAFHPLDAFMANEVNQAYNHGVLDCLTTGEFAVSFVSPALVGLKETLPLCRGTLDFIGLNVYNTCQARFIPRPPFLDISEQPSEAMLRDGPKSQAPLSWTMEPTTVLTALRKLKRYDQDVIITEAGAADDGGDDDVRRQQWMVENLACVQHALREGIRVTGFCVWTLVSNFEWDSGFVPKFGLFDVLRDRLQQQHQNRAWAAPGFRDASRVSTGTAHLYRRIIADQKR